MILEHETFIIIICLSVVCHS